MKEKASTKFSESNSGSVTRIQTDETPTDAEDRALAFALLRRDQAIVSRGSR